MTAHPAASLGETPLDGDPPDSGDAPLEADTPLGKRLRRSRRAAAARRPAAEPAVHATQPATAADGARAHEAVAGDRFDEVSGLVRLTGDLARTVGRAFSAASSAGSGARPGSEADIAALLVVESLHALLLKARLQLADGAEIRTRDVVDLSRAAKDLAAALKCHADIDLHRRQADFREREAAARRKANKAKARKAETAAKAKAEAEAAAQAGRGVGTIDPAAAADALRILGLGEEG